jgi:hypothetical protein
METIVVHPKNKKQSATVEAILKALDVSFNKEEQDTYNPEFVAKIKESERQIKEGNFITLDPTKSIWENIK